jgi:hypothetical protein
VLVKCKAVFMLGLLALVLLWASGCRAEVYRSGEGIEEEYLAGAAETTDAAFQQEETEETPAGTVGDSGYLLLNDLFLDFPDGWVMEEVQPETGDEAADVSMCVEYIIQDQERMVRMVIQPDCGYADAGPVECPEGSELIWEGEGGRGVIRFFDEDDGVFRYTRRGTAQNSAGEEVQVCYQPAVVGLPFGESVLSAHIEAVVDSGLDPATAVEQVDKLLLSVRVSP